VIKPFILACLIVKKRKDILGKCLYSLESIGGEIIIVDNGSTDKKKEIAQKLTDKVYDFKWMNNFVEARNFAASKVSGTWIIAVDADECIDINNFVAAMEEIKSYKDKISIFLVEIMSFVGDNGEEITVNTMARLYKNDGSVYFLWWNV
ncbi:TPA: glycosyltransferase, partial [Bacillus anthracis]|nr:glycosyltransferase [Bacillus anthracis]